MPPMLLKSVTWSHLSNCHGRGRGFEPRRPPSCIRDCFVESVVPTFATFVPALETINFTTLLCARLARKRRAQIGLKLENVLRQQSKGYSSTCL